MTSDIKTIIHKFKKLALDIFAPRKCAGCKKRNESFCAGCVRESFKYGAGCVFCNFRNNTGKICKQCRIKYEAPVFQILWAGEYKQPVKNAVKELKYKKRLELAQPLGELIYRKFTEYYPKHQKEDFAVMPIPMHPKKEYARGYNQAQLLAREFSKLSGILLPTSDFQLLKVTDTKTQVETKKRDERIKNLEGAFAISTKNDPNLVWVKDKTIILIDDVATTGATFMHASRALQKAGFEKIICLAIAHGYG